MIKWPYPTARSYKRNLPLITTRAQMFSPAWFAHKGKRRAGLCASPPSCPPFYLPIISSPLVRLHKQEDRCDHVATTPNPPTPPLDVWLRNSPSVSWTHRRLLRLDYLMHSKAKMYGHSAQCTYLKEPFVHIHGTVINVWCSSWWDGFQGGALGDVQPPATLTEILVVKWSNERQE